AGELPAPELVADDDDRLREVRGLEAAAGRWRDAEQRQEPGRDVDRADAFGVAEIGQREVGAVGGLERGEAGRAFPPCRERRVADRARRSTRLRDRRLAGGDERI